MAKYQTLKLYQYQHLVVNHSVEFKDDITGSCKDAVEGNKNALKMLITLQKNQDGNYIVGMLKENNLGNFFIIAL